MKKIVLALSLMLILALAGLAACGGGTSPSDVKAALEEKGYTVTMVEADGAATLTCSKGTSLLNMAFHSKDENARNTIKTAGTATGFTPKENGNWIYYGDADFITAFEEVI